MGSSYMKSVLMIWLCLMPFVAKNLAQQWQDGHATFYLEAPGGACGFNQGQALGVYGKILTTALSGPLYQNGGACGSCWLVKCVDSQWCLPASRTIKVTATDLCPPGGNGDCNPPKSHFDLSPPAFQIIAVPKGGVVPIQFARTTCDLQGGVRFTINGNPNFLLILIWNVGGDGEVVSLNIQSPQSPWLAMNRNWGENWQLSGNPGTIGKALSFQVQTSDGKSVVSPNVAPPNWQFGQTYVGRSF